MVYLIVGKICRSIIKMYKIRSTKAVQKKAIIKRNVSYLESSSFDIVIDILLISEADIPHSFVTGNVTTFSF